MSEARGRVLIIAGSDSGGGAGVQADIKAVTALGGYAATAITALTVQNTLGVSDVHPAPLEIIAAQIEAVLTDIGADAIKTGMLANTSVVATVAEAVEAHAPGVPLILDPVMIAKGGSPLLADNAVEAMARDLFPRAALVTPNAPEAARLTGVEIAGVEDLRAAGEALLAMGARAALVKGGHVPGETVRDVLVTRDGPPRVWESPRQNTRHTHGTGCTLASAIAAGVAQGRALPDAVDAARAYLQEAIRRAPGFGAGHGPVDHAWPLRLAGDTSESASVRSSPAGEDAPRGPSGGE
ncbi:MAG: bifunctional hydroxymethylpyrimidine kinase/phosphomethylpyrimidine kinase [Caulobacterales bacterium]|nr:bifunctional hydroxymethylpyrimidine kinase/phosphomethylpyrimidine kinase [Caulobacterales bacterium]